jgi:uncharacterized protein (TIGR01777 family)
MKILVSGASGLIGSALTKAASSAGHTITPLARKMSGANASPVGRSHQERLPGAVHWDPAAGTIDASALEGFDAVVHLAGESIAAARWTAEQKKRILDSRVQGTRLLSNTLAQLQRRPPVLVSASAVGFYGDSGDRVLREDSPPGNDFLANVCREWEQATEPASKAGIRVVHLRSGMVLAKEGGALPKMLLPFKMGVGGKIGPGTQYMSWIDLEDEARVILHCISHDSTRGPVNSVGPSPVTNLEFTKTLGRVLSRPTVFPLPGFMARILLGEMADALLLSSQRVQPAKLNAGGFNFRYQTLESSLRHILNR